MQKRTGSYITQTVSGESYKAYVPQKLPPDPALDLERLYPYLEKASLALAQLNSVTQTIPNTSLFIYMYVRKEALLSSQIEGTQSSFSDLMLFENNQKPEIALDDVEEVSKYVQAIQYGLDRIKNGFPLCMRLLREIHGVLLSGSRGATKLPGELRTSQNWIGGTRPGNAFFVPPPPEQMAACLSDFEKFLNDEKVPTLLKAGLAHVQFETIHPFLDGNGRLGRLLIMLLLSEGGLLEEPVLYLSLYLKQHRSLYYDLLQQVRTQGAWEEWLSFFLEGIVVASKQAMKTAERINKLFEMDLLKIATLGRGAPSCQTIFEFIKRLPQVSVSLLSKQLKISAPTARNALNNMVTLGVLVEVSGKLRDKIYVYRAYLDILEEGAAPL